MEKEKVTEELVRQNGNQSAMVMADYAGQGGGGSFSVVETIPMTQEELSLVTGVPSGKRVGGGIKIPSSLPLPFAIGSTNKICDEDSEISRSLVTSAYLINGEIDTLDVLSGAGGSSFFAPDSEASDLNLSALTKGFLYQISLYNVMS